MVNQILEVVGLVLIIAALVVIAVVCGTWSWQAGALVGAGEAGVVGTVLVLLAQARSSAARRPTP